MHKSKGKTMDSLTSKSNGLNGSNGTIIPEDVEDSYPHPTYNAISKPSDVHLEGNDPNNEKDTNEYLFFWERYKFDNKQTLPKLSISLNPLRLNEILVTRPGPRVREITYSGSEDTFETTGPTRRRKKNIREWRTEVVFALPRKRPGSCDSDPQQQDDMVILKIASEYPSIFFVDGFKDDVHSILDVLTGQKMTTFVLDAFLTRRIQFHNEQERNRVGNVLFVYIPILFLPVFDSEQDLAKVNPNVTFFPQKSISDKSKDCIFIAPQYICRHFYLAVFYLGSREIRIYDSSWKFVPIDLRLQQVRKIAAFISVKYGSSCDNWNITLVERCPQQNDEYSCGCYVVYFVENEISGDNKRSERKMTNSEISRVRTDIVSELLETSTVGSKLLEAITL